MPKKPILKESQHDVWLFKNKHAIASVQRGLQDARRGRLTKAKEDYSKHVYGKP